MPPFAPAADTWARITVESINPATNPDRARAALERTGLESAAALGSFLLVHARGRNLQLSFPQLGALDPHSGMIRYRGEMFNALADTFITSQDVRNGGKVLDTSVIIDGRIVDIAKTGFTNGRLYVPKFVLSELQYIADSSDALRRNRGRRGLEVLKQLQDDKDSNIEIVDIDFPDVREVDAKLVELAKKFSAEIITNDYSLNRVAELQGIKVLNINALANALKPVVLPGEEMSVKIIKPGKEEGQGVAYLDDGTMIVIENGKPYIGRTIDVVVTSVLQTSAGRMIFSRVPSGS